MNIPVKIRNGGDWIYGDLIQIIPDIMPVRCGMTGHISDKHVIAGVVLDKFSGNFHLRPLYDIKYINNKKVVR